VIGSILVIIGLYSVLWGKHKEQVVENKVAPDDKPLPIKGARVTGDKGTISESIDQLISEAKSNQKGEPKISVVIINCNIS
jgi:serine/threonine protein phosphatase PrpC